MVAVGVALESWVILREYREELETWAFGYFGVLPSPSRPSKKKLAVEILSVVLVTLGIVAELAVGIEIAYINGKLRVENALLRSKSDELRSKSDQLLALIGGELTEEISREQEAEKQLEAEKKKRVELAASFLPRIFFDQSGAKARLVQFPPMSIIFEYIEEQEPRAMAEQIYFVSNSLLHWTGWRKRVSEETIRNGISISVGWEPPSSFAPGTPDSVRLKMFTPEYQQKRAIGERAAQALRDAIKHCGIEAESGGLDAYGLSPTTLLIKVGRKPNHALEETLKELGPHPNPTVVGGGMMGGNREVIPQQDPNAETNRMQ